MSNGVWRNRLARVGRALDVVRRTLHLILLLIIFGGLWLLSRSPTPTMPARAALVVKLEGKLVEQLSSDSIDRAIADAASRPQPETLVRDVLVAVKSGAKDERVKALVIETKNLEGGGLTKYQEIGKALADFRATGKKVLAWGDRVSQGQYYLMAQADEVYLDPSGEVEVDGFGAYRMYFRDVIAKLAVDVNVFKVGTHKSYVEQFTRNDMSPEDREQTVAWINPLWQAYQAGIVGPRKLADKALDSYIADAVSALREAGGDPALLAEKRKLITARKTQIEFDRRVQELVGVDEDSHSFNAIDHRDYLQVRRPEDQSSARKPDKVAVVVAVGDIVDGERPPGEIGSESFARVLRDVRFDKDVKAVVLRVDSPGGSMLGSELIRQEVDALKAAGKPVVASFSSVAASGGYYIAMDTDEIWAEPTTITGSIGVFAVIPTFQRTLAKLGVGVDGVATSPLAGGVRLDRELAPDVKTVLQLGVEDAYSKFIGYVAAARKKTPAEIDAVAQGRVWLAGDALERGLVDHLGGARDAVKAAAKRAKLADGEYQTVWRERRLTWQERLVKDLRTKAARLMVRLGVAGNSPSPVSQVLGFVAEQLKSLQLLSDRRGLYYYCACDVR
jgi:protease IV